MKCYRMTYNSLQASSDRRLMYEAGLHVLATVMYSDSKGEYSYLTFAEGRITPGVKLPVTVLEVG